MALYSGKQYAGANRDMRILKQREAEERNAAYQKRIAEAAEAADS